MALLVAGADPSVTDKEGNTVAEKTSQEIKSFLEAAAAARTGSQEGKDAALLRFAGEGQTAAMQVLLRAGADPAKASAGPAGAAASVAVVRRLAAEIGGTFEPARVTGGGGGGGAGDHAQQQEEKARGGGGERGTEATKAGASSGILVNTAGITTVLQMDNPSATSVMFEVKVIEAGKKVLAFYETVRFAPLII